MTDADLPGRLIGHGRSADVYDIGGGRVLRRYRAGRSCEVEATVMAAVGAAGYPVPEVFDANGPDLVMERLDGRTMLDALASAPWRLGSLAEQLAELHLRLEQIDAGALDVPRRFGAADHLVHLDLHPDNVMLTARGPLVFDWTTAGRGPSGTDVAMTWILMSTSDVDAPLWLRPLVATIRRRFLVRFVDAVGGLPSQQLMNEVARYRLEDRNVLAPEAARLREYLAQHGER